MITKTIQIAAGESYEYKNDDGIQQIAITNLTGTDGGGGDSVDVQIDGVSIVDDGIANIPIATEAALGVCRSGGVGVRVNERGTLYVDKATQYYIDERLSNYHPIVPTDLDYSVKVAMCDGKGPAWTDEEKAAARERMGVGGGGGGFNIELLAHITNYQQAFTCDLSKYSALLFAANMGSVIPVETRIVPVSVIKQFATVARLGCYSSWGGVFVWATEISNTSITGDTLSVSSWVTNQVPGGLYIYGIK